MLKAIYAEKSLEFRIEAPRDLIVYDHQDMVELFISKDIILTARVNAYAARAQYNARL